MYVEEKIIPWVLSAISIFVAICAFRRGKKQDEKKDAEASKEEARDNVRLEMDVKYIIRGVDTIQLDISKLRDNLGELSNRITKVEASAASAHHRLDEYIRAQQSDKED